jgi:hypothetical protein
VLRATMRGCPAARRAPCQGQAEGGDCGHDFGRRAASPGRSARRRSRRGRGSWQQLTRPGIIKDLIHLGGLQADILSGGPIRVGDKVLEMLGLL